MNGPIISKLREPRGQKKCKAHKKPVGVATVRDLYGTLNHVNCNRAILASVSGFTQGVDEFIEGKPIELMDLEDYINIQKSLSKK